MATNFDFYRQAQTPFDFSPLMQAAKEKADAYRFVAQMFAHGLQEGAQAHRFNQQMKLTAMLREVEERHQQETERHNRAMEPIAEMRAENPLKVQELRNAGSLDRTNVREAAQDARLDKTQAGLDRRQRLTIDSNREAGAAMEGALNANGLQLPAGTGAAVGGKDMGILGRLIEATLKQQRAEATLKEASSMLRGQVDHAHDVGELDDATHGAITSKIVKGDISGAANLFDKHHTETVSRAEADKNVKLAADAYAKAAKQASDSGDKELAQRLAAAQTAIESFRGDPKSVMFNARNMWNSIESITHPEPKTPKVTTPSGEQFEDPTGIRLGGDIDTMTPDQKLALRGMAQTEAQKHDSRWKALDAQEAALKPENTAGAAIIKAKRNDILLEHIQAITGMNKWRAATYGGGSGQPAPARSESPAADFARRVSSGEFGHGGNLDIDRIQAEGEKLGLSPEDVMGAVGGGGH